MIQLAFVGGCPLQASRGLPFHYNVHALQIPTLSIVPHTMLNPGLVASLYAEPIAWTGRVVVEVLEKGAISGNRLFDLEYIHEQGVCMRLKVRRKGVGERSECLVISMTTGCCCQKINLTDVA